ncbi:hypothetical protein DERP_007721 [Dermatophagoides pteronyssinus]|uniref:Uncharacterized protein n=1 Tax=Dermatophagoides pteronyssinus TaxID=6956 RepID=A0ABQ8JKI9_DERPT|nr:hypothetical protein DERP_007721 [Dermatophagoides pteronyssinus]
MFRQRTCYYFHAYFSRRCSTLDRLKNHSILDRLTESSEDVASFIRFNRIIQPINIEQFRQHIADSKEMELKIQLICSEYEYLCHLNSRTPSNISIEHMKIMLNMKSSEQRQIFLIKSYFHETLKMRSKAKKIIKKKLKEQNSTSESSIYPSGIFDPSQNDLQIRYGLWKNCLFGRFSKSNRLLIQSGINSRLWNPTLAFDWYLPEKILIEDNDDKKFVTVREQNIKKLADSIFKICNKNLKSFRSSFNMVHLNLTEDLPIQILPHLQKSFEHSFLDRTFFNYTHDSYRTFFADKIVFYVDPNASTILTNEDLNIQQDLIFVFNPYSELIGFKLKFIENMFKYKQNEINGNDRIRFRRLPLHDLVVESKQRHLILSFYIECLRQVLFNQIDWMESLYKNVPKKYYKSKNFSSKAETNSDKIHPG